MEACTDIELSNRRLDFIARSGGRRRGAMVLGATLALGGCSLGGCAEEPDLEPQMPALEGSSSSSDEPEAEAEVGGEDEVEEEAGPTTPDLEAEEGRVGDLEATPGFVPDPLTQVGRTAGGPLDAHALDDRCTGWIAAQPDVILRTPRPFAELSVMVASAEDTSLMVVGPDGERRCGDDQDGAHPIVRGLFGAGEHRIWVGTARRGASAAFSLALSELESSTPSSLLH